MSRSILMRIKNKTISSPKVPILLSFIIFNLELILFPPKIPSAESARPSSWMPPVIIIPVAIVSIALNVIERFVIEVNTRTQ